MEMIVKFEIVQGTFKSRSNQEMIYYKNLKLFTMSINEHKAVWDNEVKEDSKYEEVISSGGVRERPRIWVPLEDMKNKSKKTDADPYYNKGTNVQRFLNCYSLSEEKAEKLIGISLDDFKETFVEDFFLHGVKVTTSTNEYGRVTIETIEISEDTVFDALEAAAS